MTKGYVRVLMAAEPVFSDYALANRDDHSR